MIREAVAMLVGDRTKYAGVLLGVAITTFLTTLMTSMFAGMLTRTYSLVSDNPDVDVWVMDPACETVTQTINMPETALERVRGVPGVAGATRLAMGSAPARLPTGRFTPVDVVGVDEATLAGVPAGAPADVVSRLRGPDAVLVDEGGTWGKLAFPVLGTDAWGRGRPRLEAPQRPLEPGDEFLVNNAAVRMAGRVSGGPRFQPQPVVYTTYANSDRVLPGQRHRLTFVLARVAPGRDAREVARDIERTTGLKARSGPDLKRDTVVWFLVNSEFLAHVGVMVLSATAVGFTITGLMLYMFTSENARSYATLRAIGASGAMLVRMIAAQSLLAGVVGFGLGIGLCMCVGALLAPSGFPFRVMWYAPIGVCGLVLLITAASGLLSARAVLRVEPAMVFKG